MKKDIVLVGLFVFCFQIIIAETQIVTWNLGTVDIVWNNLEKKDVNTWSANQVSMSFLDIQLNDTNHNWGLASSLVQYRKYENITSMYSVFPLEVYYDFFKNDSFLFGPYLKGEINFGENMIYPLGEIGIKLGTFVLNDPNKLHYSWRNSAYIGYDTNMHLNIGTQIDFGTIVLLCLSLHSEREKD